MATGTPLTGPSDAAIKPSPRRSQPSSPRKSPVPPGVSSQTISTMSASSSVPDDYRPKTPRSTSSPTPGSSDKFEVKKEAESAIVVPASPSLSSSVKGDPFDDEPMDRDGYSYSGMDKARQIFGRIAGLIPVLFISMTLTYASLYVLNKESFGTQAATFVGVAGFVYSIFAAFHWELIPPYQLSRKENDGKLMRNCIDLTCTFFTTSAFNMAVLKLTELTSTQGFIFFSVSYGLSYAFLKHNYLRNLFKPPTSSQLRA